MWYSFGLGFAQINPAVRNGPKAIYEAMMNLYPQANRNRYNYEDPIFKLPVSYAKSVNALNEEAKKRLNEIFSSKSDGFVVFGGEHFISYSILNALSSHYKRFSVLHFDAHLDMQDIDPDPEGKNARYTRATWARRAMEELNIKKWICVGIRDFDDVEKDFADEQKVEIYSPEKINIAKKAVSKIKGPLYISIDIDSLDPSVAPSVSVPVPMGLEMRDLLGVLEKAPKPVGFDIVELACRANKHDRTAMAAVFLLREYLAVLDGK